MIPTPMPRSITGPRGKEINNEGWFYPNCCPDVVYIEQYGIFTVEEEEVILQSKSTARSVRLL